MPLYEADGNNKHKPILRTELVRTATIPDACIIQQRPNYVLINNTGSFAFLNTSTGSLNGTSHYNANNSTAGNETWVTASIIHPSVQGGVPVRLDINPVAWRQTNGTITGTTGDVTFVFNAKSIQKKA